MFFRGRELFLPGNEDTGHLTLSFGQEGKEAGAGFTLSADKWQETDAVRSDE
jgi:hypothetical protein